jgi:hypothetical protein
MTAGKTNIVTGLAASSGTTGVLNVRYSTLAYTSGTTLTLYQYPVETAGFITVSGYTPVSSDVVEEL